MKITGIWYYDGEKVNHLEMDIGQRVTVYKPGVSMRNKFGEGATLEKATTRYLVFKTDSGATVKTACDNLHKVAGKAGRNGWNVLPDVPENVENLNRIPVIL